MTSQDLPASTDGDDLPPPPLPPSDASWGAFLDVDGTLLDFVDDPAAVAVSPSLLALLYRLHAQLGGALALVSGRGADDLDTLFSQPPWALAGLHGLQLRHADGSRNDHPVDPAVRQQLKRGAQALLEGLDGVQLEDKGDAIALHCRRMPQRFDAMRTAAQQLASQTPGFELQGGNLVMEIKPAGMDKGKAVTELLQRPPFIGRKAVYLGDDLTDEHGFEAVTAAGGFGIRVGTRTPTAARFTLPDPAAVQDWLARWLASLPSQR